jgi:hypothetical protein
MGNITGYDVLQKGMSFIAIRVQAWPRRRGRACPSRNLALHGTPFAKKAKSLPERAGSFLSVPVACFHALSIVFSGNPLYNKIISSTPALLKTRRVFKSAGKLS